MKEEIVKVSSKGQIVLPSDIREELNIDKGRRMVMTVHKGAIIMKPIRKLSEMEGILKDSKLDAEKIIRELRKEWDLEL